MEILFANATEESEPVSRRGSAVTAETARPKLTQRATASLIVLMATAREVSNSELAELSGFRLDGSDRRQLNDLGWVASRLIGGSYAHVLTEEGWRAAHGLLGAERPAKAGSFGGALFALLAGISVSLDRAGLTPAEFFGASTAQDGAQPAASASACDGEHVESAAESGTAASLEAAEADAGAVESAIRAAYAGLADQDGGWVGLASLRARLGGYSRAEVDRALRTLAVQPGVHIVPVANLKSLTSTDREAALRLGGEDNHALAIEAR